MSVTISNNGKEMNLSYDNQELISQIAIHELGHHYIATALGYNAVIIFNPFERIHHTQIEFNSSDSIVQDLKNKITVGLGGKVAEDICGFQTMGFMMGDLPIIFNDLKQLYSIQGKEFPFSKYGSLLTTNVWEEEENSAKEILTSLGGKNFLYKMRDYVFEQTLKK